LAGSSFRWPIVVASIACMVHAPSSRGQASSTGQSGLIHMPDARVEPEGTWRLGAGNSDPYFTLWSSVTVLPRLELSGRFTRIDNVPAFSDGSHYGDYKDKAFDAKLMVWKESAYLPAASIGVQDFTGTRLFRARYVALGKQIGDVDATLGYGEQRLDRWFGGLRYTPGWNPRWSVVAERDANRYAEDYRAELSGAAMRRGGATFGIEYRFGWATAQLSSQHGTTSGLLYVSIPLGKREFVPKIDEPPPPAVAAAPPTGAALRTAPSLTQRLTEDGFGDVTVAADGPVLRISLNHPRITLMGRAIGRAARTALASRSHDIQVLEITYTSFDMPVLVYRFSDLDLLARYFREEIPLEQLQSSVEVRYPAIDDADRVRREALNVDNSAAPAAGAAGDGIPLKPDTRLAGFSAVPINVRFFFNDPSGVVHYDTFSTLAYDKRLAPGWFVHSAARLTLFEDVSDVTQPSNSQLPHVRSDIADYRREGGRLRLESLLLNRYVQVHERVYARLSAGYYEEMYGGAGGQVMYLPARGEWAADMSLDWLKQRRPGDSFGFRDYTTLTALGAVHYRFPASGVTATARAGRFLARDEGVRMELKRRFRSGVELGAWYTVTNGDDTTGPGRPDNPYRDKGVFVSVPLSTMLTRDTQQRAEFALVDFTRDVGQMVVSPGDLYRLFEQRLLFDAAEYGALSGLSR